MTIEIEQLKRELASTQQQLVGLQAQLAVLTAFCQSTIHTLTPEAQRTVEASFSDATNQVLGVSDESPQFAAHHSVVLALANALLGEFERQRRLRASRGDAGRGTE